MLVRLCAASQGYTHPFDRPNSLARLSGRPRPFSPPPATRAARRVRPFLPLPDPATLCSAMADGAADEIDCPGTPSEHEGATASRVEEETGGDDETSSGNIGNGAEPEDLLAPDLAGLTLEDPEARAKVLKSLNIEGVADFIQQGKAKKIVVLTGAGISVSAGIPDFRTPGTGLYDNLQKYKLSQPEDVFCIDFFQENPEPFYQLAKELFPGGYNATPTHHFIKLLHDKDILARCYTQNIDSLESMAGLPASALVAAHGNFDTASCIKCHKNHTKEFVKEAIMKSEPAKCSKCGGLVKPDIVFFGENLPARFMQLCGLDLKRADLLIVMGTSLQVQPFASLIDMVKDNVPRLLINRERAGEAVRYRDFTVSERGFNFGEGNYRDALFLGDCDEGVKRLAKLLGWEKDLDALCSSSK